MAANQQAFQIMHTHCQQNDITHQMNRTDNDLLPNESNHLKGCGMYSIRSTLGRRTISTSALRRCYDPRNRISMAYNATLKRAVPSGSESSKPLFLTKDSFEEHIKSQRMQSVGEDYGLKPTKMQKIFLLATHIYEKDADIPAYVASTTMNRMYDRMRILSSTFGITLFFIVLYCCQLASINKIKQAREDADYKMHS